VTVDAPHLGVLTGIRSEADALIRHLPKDLKVTVCLSAARPEKARREAARLIAEGATHLLSFGYAGGLDPALPPGTVLVPRSVVGPDGQTYLADGDWLDQTLSLLQRHYPFAAAHLGSDEPIVDVEQKATAFLRSRGAAGVDMESHVLATAARASERPFLAIRVVLDSASHTLPRAAMAAVKPDGSISLARLAGSLVLRPAQIMALNRLARAQQAAEKALLSCCSRAGPAGFGVR
jgi:adenosylhomocysteine nucleosidase